MPVSRHLLYKCLYGDDSDKIPGIPSIGKIRALELVSKYSSFEKILEDFTKKEKRYAMEQSVIDNVPIYERNLKLMDLKLCFQDETLKLLVKRKVNEKNMSRENLFDTLSEFRIENLTDKILCSKS